MTERERLFTEARRIKSEIEQIFIDCASWNENARQPGDALIDPDPDGALRSAVAYCDGVLRGDVYIAPERTR